MTNITSPGLGSGLDVNGIVSQLVAAEQVPAQQRLDRKEADLQARLSGFGLLRSAISSFQDSLAVLADTSGYQAMTASSSDTAVAGVSVGNTAAEGAYSMSVTQLASAQSLVSDASLPAAQFSSASDILGTGALTFNFGTTSYDPDTDTYTPPFLQNPDKGAQTVQITDGSLTGIRDAVNQADIGVSASIIFDGANYRLTFTSEDTGAANSLEITVADDDGNDTDGSGLSLLSFNENSTNLLQTQAAQDAQVTLNGIVISSPVNTLEENIEGMTISLSGVGSTTLTVTKDASAISTNISNFVSQYNNLVSTISDLSVFDPATGQAGILNGDALLRSVDSQFRRILAEPVTGLDADFATLANIGITRNSLDGTLELDNAMLTEAINTNPDAVTGLFAAYGTASDSLIQVSGFTDNTVGGNYAVNISQLATQGQVTGSAAAVLSITTGVNDTLSLSVDGVAATVTLAAGSYTAATLAAELQSRVNSASEIQGAGLNVTVAENAGILSIVSDSYGSASTVTIDGGSAAADLFGASPVSTAGVDVAGTIDGVAATGSGQVLTAASGGAEGLAILVKGGSPGDRGSVSFSRGYADQLGSVLSSMLDDDGIFASVTDSLNDQISSINDDREALARRMESYEERLRAQYTALDVLVSNLTAMSDFLTTQLNSLPVIGANNQRRN